MQEEQYSSDNEMEKYAHCTKRLASLPEENEEKVCARGLLDLAEFFEWTHFQFLHDNINASFCDIAYGDVFELKDYLRGSGVNKIGVVITQPCDCTIRNGVRKSNQFTIVIFDVLSITKEDLIEPETSSQKKSWAKNIKKLRNSAVFLDKTKNPDSSWTIRYFLADTGRDAIQISPFILDLASLNKDGKPVLLADEALKKAIATNKPDNWREYTPLLITNVNEFVNESRLLGDLPPEHRDFVLQHIYNISYSPENNQFNLRRLGRLTANLVEYISYHYVAHTYRTGKNSLLSLHVDNNIENGVIA